MKVTHEQLTVASMKAATPRAAPRPRSAPSRTAP